MRRDLAAFVTLLLALAPPPQAAACTPSGSGVPAFDLQGWHYLSSDDFTTGTVPNANWGLYSGQPGGAPLAQWAPSHCVVSGGNAVLRTYQDAAFPGKWTSCGMWYNPNSQLYGKYLVRWRCDKGDGVACIGLLWPSTPVWPPEIDFFEDGGGNRTATAATLHYGANNSQIQSVLNGDFTQWHTLGVEWTAGQLKYTIDGVVWATQTNANVPNIAMNFVLQTQMWTPTANTPPETDMFVDWIALYSPCPGCTGPSMLMAERGDGAGTPGCGPDRPTAEPDAPPADRRETGER